MTDTLSRKELLGQVMGQGFLPTRTVRRARCAIDREDHEAELAVSGQDAAARAAGTAAIYENTHSNCFLAGDFIKRGLDARGITSWPELSRHARTAKRVGASSTSTHV
jgi:hypothetical protein